MKKSVKLGVNFYLSLVQTIAQQYVIALLSADSTIIWFEHYTVNRYMQPYMIQYESHIHIILARTSIYIHA